MPKNCITSKRRVGPCPNDLIRVGEQAQGSGKLKFFVCHEAKSAFMKKDKSSLWVGHSYM